MRNAALQDGLGLGLLVLSIAVFQILSAFIGA